MAEENDVQTADETTEVNSDGDASTNDVVDSSAENSVDEISALQTQLAELKKFKADTVKAADDAKRKALADQQKWQELASTETERATLLESQLEEANGKYSDLETELEQYKSMLETQIGKQKDNLPDDIKTLVNSLGLVEQINWLNEHGSKYNSKIAPPPSSSNGDGINIDHSQLEAARKKFGNKVKGFF